MGDFVSVFEGCIRRVELMGKEGRRAAMTSSSTEVSGDVGRQSEEGKKKGNNEGVG